ncbi:hypothetical protein G8Y85_11945 [Staphylococcus sp. 11007852]|uniref:hypothetical protein n=1 Tax=Staphylococcus TaxID=1279 RepID=UPI0014036A64|nr:MULTISPECIES: hypothetical protein [Staphylococcus]NHM76110.1 hypothetical protein [Staphylococcus sp. 11007852]NJH82830.1 hypothetical protein [Staphylococcus agnetis]
MKKSFILFISSSLILLILILSISVYFIYQLNKPNIQTIRATFTYPQYLKGIVQSDYNYILKYNENLGFVQDIHVKDNEKVTIDQPLITYHNPSKIPLIHALNQLLSSQLNANQIFEINKEIIQLKSDLYHTIPSPAEGIVRLHEFLPDKNKEKILEISSKEQHILVKVPEHLYTKFKKAQPVTLRSTLMDKTVKGTVVSTHFTPTYSPEISRKTYYFIKIKTPKTYPIGTHFEVQFSKPQMILPRDILLDENSVLIYKKSKLVKRIISYDRINEQLIIKNGIFAGEKVVRYPHEINAH